MSKFHGELTGRVLYRCPKCKARWAKDYEVTSRAVTRYDYWNKPFTATVLELAGCQGDMNGNCPKCNFGYVNCDEVRGITKPDHKCNGICMNAKGGDCECSCGGKNHGASFLS